MTPSVGSWNYSAFLLRAHTSEWFDLSDLTANFYSLLFLSVAIGSYYRASDLPPSYIVYLFFRRTIGTYCRPLLATETLFQAVVPRACSFPSRSLRGRSGNPHYHHVAALFPSQLTSIVGNWGPDDTYFFQGAGVFNVPGDGSPSTWELLL